MSDLLTREELYEQWRLDYTKAIEACPVEFQPMFTELLFAAQRTMGNLVIVATLDAFTAASKVVQGQFKTQD